MRRFSYPLSIALVLILALGGVVYAQRQDIAQAVIKNLTVTGDADMRGDVTVGGDFTAGVLTVVDEVVGIASTTFAYDDVTITDTLTVGGKSTTGDIAVTGNVTVSGNLSALNGALSSDTLNVTTDAAIDGFATVGFLDATDGGAIAGILSLTPATLITVTQSMTLTPNSTIQPLASAGAVGFGVIVPSSNPGDVVVFVNTGAQTITISETSTIVSAGNVALGAGDTVTYARVGSKWYQIGPVGNN